MSDKIYDGAYIRARISVNTEGEPVVLVRKIVFDNNKFVSKHALSQSGEWVQVEEGQAYPKEAYLEAGIISSKSDKIAEYAASLWERSGREEDKTLIEMGIVL